MRYLFRRERVQSVYDSYFKTASEHTPLTQPASAPITPEQNGVQDLSVSPVTPINSYTPTPTPGTTPILGNKDDGAGSVSENQK